MKDNARIHTARMISFGKAGALIAAFLVIMPSSGCKRRAYSGSVQPVQNASESKAKDEKKDGQRLIPLLRFDGMNGSVDMVTTMCGSAVCFEDDIWSQGHLLWGTRTHYDSSGNAYESVGFGVDGSENERTTYTFTDGLLTQTSTKLAEDSSPSVTTLVSRDGATSTWKITGSQDGATTQTVSEEPLIRTTTTKGAYPGNGKPWSETKVETFDRSGRRTSLVYTSNGADGFSQVFEYDSRGLLTWDGRYSYRYTRFDVKDNWIERWVYEGDFRGEWKDDDPAVASGDDDTLPPPISKPKTFEQREAEIGPVMVETREINYR